MSEATELLKADLAEFNRKKEEAAAARRRARRNPNAVPRLSHAERCSAFYAVYSRIPRKAVAEAFSVSTAGIAKLAAAIRFPKIARTPGGRPIVARDEYSTPDEFDGPHHSLSYAGRKGSPLPPAPPTIDPYRANGVYRTIAQEFLATSPEAFGEQYFDRYMRNRVFRAMEKEAERKKLRT